MRRWLTIFLLVLLPLQFGWAAAARYCLHESLQETTNHFGHHEHQHAASQTSPSDGTGKDVKLFGDDDCAYCHLGAAKPVRTEVQQPGVLDGSGAPPGPLVHPLGTRGPDRLERPNWRIA